MTYVDYCQLSPTLPIARETTHKELPQAEQQEPSANSFRSQFQDPGQTPQYLSQTGENKDSSEK
jgi:hypothetical protein